ncbi:MAG: hypothetical protein WAW00_02940 [Candidatus Moraniibacteriota bacterium]
MANKTIIDKNIQKRIDAESALELVRMFADTWMSLDAGKEFAGERYEEGIAYPGAKPSMHIDEDLIDDHAWLSLLIWITAEALLASKPKKRKAI